MKISNVCLVDLSRTFRSHFGYFRLTRASAALGGHLSSLDSSVFVLPHFNSNANDLNKYQVALSAHSNALQSWPVAFYCGYWLLKSRSGSFRRGQASVCCSWGVWWWDIGGHSDKDCRLEGMLKEQGEGWVVESRSKVQHPKKEDSIASFDLPEQNTLIQII